MEEILKLMNDYCKKNQIIGGMTMVVYDDGSGRLYHYLLGEVIYKFDTTEELYKFLTE